MRNNRSHLKTKKEEKSFETVQKCLDIVCVLVCWCLSYVLRFKVAQGQPGLEFFFLKLSPSLVFITFLYFKKYGLYRSGGLHRNYVEISSIFKANTLAFFSFVIVLYFFADERLSRTTLILYYLLSTFFLTLLRIFMKNHLRNLRRKGKNLRSILLVGNGTQLDEYIRLSRQLKDSGIRFCARIGLTGNGKYQDIPEIKEEDYQSFVKNNPPDAVVIGHKASESRQVELFLKENHNDIIPFQILPDLSFSLVGHKIEDFAGIPFININYPPYGPLEITAKRLLDFFSSLIGMVFLSPFLLCIGIGVKCSSSGPVFYGQKRVGLDGEEFTMWKFRTMEMPKNGEDETSWGSRHNPRKTPFGTLLRKTGLDELPQLYNVLMGHMSLVGPRPERVFFVNQFRKEIPIYMLRHKIRSGITGWAQINGFRGDTNIEKRVEYDIHYIKHWSFWLDLKIIFLTFWKGLLNKNAY